MKTNIAETSKSAYYSHVASGAKLKQREAILEYVGSLSRHASVTRRQIARALGFETGATAGRVNLLVKDGLLEELPDKGKCQYTDKMVGLVRIPRAEVQLDLI